MKTKHALAIAFALLSITSYTTASAYEGDWKRGRVYYRQVCTTCHTAKLDTAVSPSAMTKAEWAAYIKADKHARGKESLKHYVSKQYRVSIKASNKAAEKFIDVPDAELMEDLKAFVEHGAKDGDSPASCS